MEFEFDSKTPIYIQIIDQIKIDIISGKIGAGERLSSVRDIAFNLKVNPNTVQKALSELEELGLIYTERTNGKFVTCDLALIEKYKKEHADRLCERFLENMKTLGFSGGEVTDYLNKFGGNR